MAKSKIELTEGEWAIMKAVWRDQPCAAPTVQEALQATRKWSYSTVRTLMDRMVDKGLLTAEKVRNLTLYRAAVTSAQAQEGEVLYTLKHAFNGALGPMVECLLGTRDLSAAELAGLERLIQEKRNQRKD
jgi:BlaI family transcriptional regulator, penicillinase repressor